MKITTVMPVYNMASTLPAAVESIVNQTESDADLIVVDDGSTDETSTVLHALEERYRDRITVMFRPHYGLPEALNAGINRADCAYVARMDADDVAHPDRLARQGAFLHRHPDIGVVGSAAHMPMRPDNEGYRRYTAWVNHLHSWRALRRARFVESPLIHPTVMVRRELFSRYGAYRSGPFPEDYELWLRWFDRGVAAANLPDTLLIWNDPPERFSRTPTAMQARASFFRMKAWYVARFTAPAAAGRPVYLWGAGRITRRRMEPLDPALSAAGAAGIAGLIDVRPSPPKPFGTRKLPVMTPDRLPPPERCFVIAAVGTRGVRGMIASYLARRGFCYEKDWIAAA